MVRLLGNYKFDKVEIIFNSLFVKIFFSEPFRAVTAADTDTTTTTLTQQHRYRDLLVVIILVAVPKGTANRQIIGISYIATQTRKSLVKGERFIRAVWMAEMMP